MSSAAIHLNSTNTVSNGAVAVGIRNPAGDQLNQLCLIKGPSGSGTTGTYISGCAGAIVSYESFTSFESYFANGVTVTVEFEGYVITRVSYLPDVPDRVILTKMAADLEKSNELQQRQVAVMQELLHELKRLPGKPMAPDDLINGGHSGKFEQKPG